MRQAGQNGWCATPVGLATLEGNTILVWCGNTVWAERACSGPGPDPLVSARSTSFPEHDIAGAKTDGLAWEIWGSKKFRKEKI